MANKKVSDNPHWNAFVQAVDPLKTRLDEVKRRNEQRILEAKAEIEADRKAAVQAALANGISKTAIARHLGITSGVRQKALFEEVLGRDWLGISTVSNGKYDQVPFEKGDWRVVRDHINHLREHPMRQGSGPAFCEGRLWNDVLGLDLKFSINYGDQSTVTYFQQDGTPFDSAHIEEFATADWNGYTTFDDGTFYERGEPGRWFTEGADVADWLEFGYRNKREGWPQP